MCQASCALSLWRISSFTFLPLSIKRLLESLVLIKDILKLNTWDTKLLQSHHGKMFVTTIRALQFLTCSYRHQQMFIGYIKEEGTSTTKTVISVLNSRHMFIPVDDFLRCFYGRRDSHTVFIPDWLDYCFLNIPRWIYSRHHGRYSRRSGFWKIEGK